MQPFVSDYQDLKRGNRSFESFAVWAADAYLWHGPAGTQALRVGRVSGNFFATFGVLPTLGRLFSAQDDTASAPRTVVLPYLTWLRDFGARTDVIGKSITLDNTSYIVIGVLPRTFQFAPRAAELWVTIHDLGACENDRACRVYSGVARLKDGFNLAAASTEMRTTAARLEKQYPESNKDQSASVLSFRQSITGDLRPVLLTLFTGATLLLLIALTNTATLLLVRGEARRHEMAVRNALGASFPRLLRQLGGEAALLVLVSIPLGLGASWAAVHLFAPIIPERLLRAMPFFTAVELDGHVLLFVCLIALIAWLTCTLALATRLSRTSQPPGFSSGVRISRSHWRGMGSSLVSAEVALAVTLLVSAGLLSKSLYRILHVDLNFNPSHLATLEIDANTGYDTPAQQLALTHNLVEAVSAVPGVRSTATVRSVLPVSCYCDSAPYRVLGQEWNPSQPPVLSRTVSSDYLQTLQAPLLRGRYFSPADDAAHPAAVIINAAMARQYFPNQDPIEQTIGDAQLSPASLRLVVGVIQDIHEGALSDPSVPAAYFPAEQNPAQTFFLVARTTLSATVALPSIVTAVHRAAPQVGVRNEATMDQHIHDSPAAYFRSISAVLLAGFSACAIVLGAVGLYGVISYSVAQREREIGIRMALGAQRSQIGQLILGEGTKVVAAGLLFGMAATIITGRFLGSLLFAVHPWDPLVLTLVISVLTLVSLIAAWLPARRAAAVNPNEALRRG